MALLLVLALVIGVSAVLLLPRRSGKTSDPGVSPGVGAQAEVPATVGDPGIAGASSPGVDATGTTESRAAGGPAADEFEGRGSIRGQVILAEGLELPDSWTVHVGPSRSLRGRQRAASREVEFGDDSAEFVVEDLPLGGYDVWIEAEGLRSKRHAVLLTRGSSSPYMILQLSRMGFIDGYVVRDGGAPAEDLLVGLEPIPAGVRREARTRPDGSYRFDNVEDGEYRLHFGPAASPLVPARDLYFRAPSLRFPEITLPATADLLIHSQDASGAMLADVTVSGFGAQGGRIEVTTGADGKAWARHLPPGLYRLRASAPDGRRTRESFEVTLEDGQECWLILR